MTVGKMDLIICDMIELGLIQAISSHRRADGAWPGFVDRLEALQVQS